MNVGKLINNIPREILLNDLKMLSTNINLNNENVKNNYDIIKLYMKQSFPMVVKFLSFKYGIKFRQNFSNTDFFLLNYDFTYPRLFKEENLTLLSEVDKQYVNNNKNFIYNVLKTIVYFQSLNVKHASKTNFIKGILGINGLTESYLNKSKVKLSIELLNKFLFYYQIQGKVHSEGINIDINEGTIFIPAFICKYVRSNIKLGAEFKRNVKANILVSRIESEIRFGQFKRSEKNIEEHLGIEHDSNSGQKIKRIFDTLKDLKIIKKYRKTSSKEFILTK